jgi:hypothetical protein
MRMKSTPLNSHLLAGVIALTAVFLLIHPCDASGQSRTTLSLPEFLPGQRLMADGKELRVTYQSGSTTNFNYYSVPCVMDWNGDGKKDLLTGAFYYGNIYLYLNSGADSAPILISSGKIRADGYDLHVDYG